MEKEKKKLLLIAISVGIFLVIAIGAAILIITPKNTATPSGAITSHTNTPGAAQPLSSDSMTANSTPDNSAPVNSTLANSGPDAGGAASSQPATTDPVGLVRNPGGVPGLKTAPDGNYRPDSDYYVVEANPPGQGKSNETVISVPKPATVAVPSPAPARSTSTPARPASETANSGAQTVTSKPQAPEQKTAKPAAPAKSQTKAPVKAKPRDDFWVQTGAFSTITSAEGVKETLASKGITSIIENRDVNGSNMFRVRVGPYTSKNEADYWLSLIKSIDGFENSQVRQTQSLQ